MFPRARTPDGEIEGAGGAYVRRKFPFRGKDLVSGDKLTADEVASIPDINLRSLINLNVIELFPKAPKSKSKIEEKLREVLAEQNAEIERLRALPPPPTPTGPGDCFLMSAPEDSKKFHIVQGRQITDQPLSRAQAAAKMKELTQP